MCQYVNYVGMVVEVCGIIEIGFTLQLYFHSHDIALEMMKKNEIHHLTVFFFEGGGWLLKCVR
jgi:hypothetical protein